jgi:hypothetical protein
VGRLRDGTDAAGLLNWIKAMVVRLAGKAVGESYSQSSTAGSATHAFF